MRAPQDPIDHARTTRPHAGESMKDTKNFPALVLLGVALAIFVGGLVAFATTQTVAATVLSVIAAVLFVGSMAWFLVAHQRVRRIEERWDDRHLSAPRQDASS